MAGYVRPPCDPVPSAGVLNRSSNTCSTQHGLEQPGRPVVASWRRRCPGAPANGASLTGGPEADGGDSPAWSRKRRALRRRHRLAPTPGERVPVRRAALPLQLQLPRRRQPPRGAGRGGRRGWGSTRSRSPTTTACTAWSGSPRRPPSWACARSSAPSSRLGLSAPQNGVADPEGSHLLLLARDPEGYRAALPHDQHRAAARARRRAGRSTTSTRWSPTPRARCVVLTGCRKGAVRQALRAGGRDAGGQGAAPAGRAVRGRPRRRRAHRPGLPTDTERNDVLAELARDAGLPDGRHHRRALRAPRAGSRWPRRWPRCGPGAASTRSTAGSRRPAPPTCAPARRWRPGSTPATRARWRGRRELGTRVRVPIDLVAPDLPPFPVPPGHTEASWLRELTRRGMAVRYGSHAEYPEAVETDRARAGDHRAEELPRLLPDRARHRRVLPPGRHPLPGPGLGGQLRGLLRAGHHQRRRGGDGPAVRAVPLPGPGGLPRHRPGHRVRPPRGGRSSTSTQTTAAAAPPRWPT